MSQRRADGSAGDADYGAIGGVYTDYRKPDPRIGRYIVDALGDARTVLNVGAGAGGYEPEDREVTAVEPSASMRSQRPAHLSPAVDAVVEQLPFPDRSFEGAMSTFSVHQWNDLWAGLREMRRVTRLAFLRPLDMRGRTRAEGLAPILGRRRRVVHQRDEPENLRRHDPHRFGAAVAVLPRGDRLVGRAAESLRALVRELVRHLR